MLNPNGLSACPEEEKANPPLPNPPLPTFLPLVLLALDDPSQWGNTKHECTKLSGEGGAGGALAASAEDLSQQTP